MTLTGAPQIIFLDEPTTGLDPRSRLTMWESVRGLVADGTTCSSPPSNSRRPTGSPTRSRSSTRDAWSPRGPRRSSSGASPAAASTSSSPTPARAAPPRGALHTPIRDEDALTLQIPTDGNVATLRRVLRAR